MASSEGTIAKSVAAGAVAGIAGAWAMNQFQALLSSLSQTDQQTAPQPSEESEDATVKTAEAISQTVFDHKLDHEEKQWAGPAVHYGFGASVGAVYGALAETAPVASAGFGTVYGTAVWAIADEMAIPAFGLSKPIPQTKASSHANAFASHLIYGIVTDLVRRGLLRLSS